MTRDARLSCTATPAREDGQRPIHDPLERELIIAAVLGTDIPRRLEVAKFLAAKLRAANSRAHAAPRSARKRSANIEAGIRKALANLLPGGALPVDRDMHLPHRTLARIKILGPKKFGLRRAPDIERIREVIRDMVREREAANLARQTEPSAAFDCDEALPQTRSACDSHATDQPRETA